MIEAKFFTVGTYLYKYNLTVLFVSPSKISHDKFYIYCPPLLLNEIYTHGLFDSSRSTEMYFRGEELWYECTHVITIFFSNIRIAWLHQQISFYISFAFVNTIGCLGLGLV